MKHMALEEFTKMKEHYGKDTHQILEKFLFYASGCQDPENVYKFMEEKSICTFCPNYWIHKAEHFADIGNYTSAFQCMQEAISRYGAVEDQNQKIVDPEAKLRNIKHSMMEEMKRQPLKRKRTVEQFNLLSNSQTILGDQNQTNKQLLEVYEEKYACLKKEKQDKYFKMQESKPFSWLYQIYQQQDEKDKKLQEKLEKSHRLSRQNTYYSMHTPIKSRQKMIKRTMDSVEMLKKKKTSRFKDQTESENQDNTSNDKISMFHSIPVGRKFAQLSKRRVTFQMHNRQKIREKDHRSSSILKSTTSILTKTEKSEENCKQEQTKEENISNKTSRQ